MLPTLLTSAVALAAPPLVVAVDEAEPGLRAWWREGEVLVAPPAGDPRPGVKPLVGPAPIVLPDDLEGWTPLLGECPERPPTAALPVGGRTATVLVDASEKNVMLQVKLEDRVIAEGALGRPAVPCSLHIGQADALPGYEVLLGWRTPAGVQGLTVFRVPETALDPAATAPATEE
jgi:hypothetical protein